MRLPNPKLMELVDPMKQGTTRSRRAWFADTDGVYDIYQGDDETAGLIGCCDDSLVWTTLRR